MKVEIKSILRKCTEQLEGYDFIHNRVIIHNLISDSNIKESDKRKMLYNIKTVKDNEQLKRYVYNALLKYEGCGVIR